MKKTVLLHAELSQLIASLGHGDALVIADAGLPVPPGVRRIDVAITRGVPTFAQVLHAVLSEMQVERALYAEEMRQRSPATLAELEIALAGALLAAVPHEDFKQRTREARAVVRTGEFTPYANVLLVAGVVF